MGTYTGILVGFVQIYADRNPMDCLELVPLTNPQVENFSLEPEKNILCRIVLISLGQTSFGPKFLIRIGFFKNVHLFDWIKYE